MIYTVKHKTIFILLTVYTIFRKLISTLSNYTASWLPWILAVSREKGRDLPQSFDKSPYSKRKCKTPIDNTKTKPKTSITQRLRIDLGNETQWNFSNLVQEYEFERQRIDYIPYVNSFSLCKFIWDIPSSKRCFAFIRWTVYAERQ